MFPPEVLLIGAQKSGTSTLAYYLSQHPEICVSDPKEIHYYSRYWDKSLEWYKSKFSDLDKLCIDASTTYSMANLQGDETSIPERVYSINPESKFIYIMRDPVQRAYSGYWHNVRTGRENRDFYTAMADNDTDMLDISNYYEQLKIWFEYFPKESFHFILFEDLKQDPQAVLNKCFKFLGVEQTDIDTSTIKNKSYNVSVIGRKLNSLVRKYPFLLKIRNIVPEILINKVRYVRRGKSPIPKISQEQEEYLSSYFNNKNSELERVINIPLDKWKGK
ncbi:sulfotransferase domain-containing protein [Halobacillus andaensis]|uniref:sulfotransferase domain-containing protein n=1 Tax=Halobacillus andaensis TaxID=1176239 RepID=UPI003D752724